MMLDEPHLSFAMFEADFQSQALRFRMFLFSEIEAQAASTACAIQSSTSVDGREPLH